MFPIEQARMSEGVLLIMEDGKPFMFMEIDSIGLVSYIETDSEAIAASEGSWISEDLEATEIDIMSYSNTQNFTFHFMDA